MSLKETKKVATNRYELEIIVEGEKFREAITQAYKNNADKISIPGFRKGKAPFTFVEKYYGSEVFFEDALNLIYADVVDEAYEQAYERSGVYEKMSKRQFKSKDLDKLQVNNEDFEKALVKYNNGTLQTRKPIGFNK